MNLDLDQCLAALDAGAWLVDVREGDEVARMAYAHPRCLHLPLSELAQRFGELPQDRPLVMACAAGGRSAQALNFLRAQGHPQVSHLVGGMAVWAARGQPTRSGTP